MLSKDSENGNVALSRAKVDAFSKHLKNTKRRLITILSEYQSYATSEYEFARIFECLASIENIALYLTRRTGSVAAFFPLNMPIYALVLYGIHPALVADEVFIRAPQRMSDLLRKLVPVLEIQSFFPNIKLVFASREEFVSNYVATADVNIFTGKLINAQHVMNRTKKNSLFIFNGWGCNPVVVGSQADLEIAAAKTVEARLFGSGQDCAGPDTILVHQHDVDEFVLKAKTKLNSIKIGSYTEPDVLVGPLADSDQIRSITSIFLSSDTDIVHGGYVDFQRSIVHPTIIVCPLRRRMNFQELFAPVMFVNTYENDEELANYFEHPQYINNEMYVTLFGKSQYVESLKRSILVREQVVFDIDRGNEEYGGFSIGASFVASHRNVIAKPVLVPREIFEYLEPSSLGHRLTPGNQKKISKLVWKAVFDTFASNLVFGFVYGSIACETANAASDINTMIVVHEINADQNALFLNWLEDLHHASKLSFREGISGIIVSRTTLDAALKPVQRHEEDGTFDLGQENNLFVEALSGRQTGVSGDKQLCVQYGRSVMKYSKAFRQRKGREVTIAPTLEITVGPSPDEVSDMKTATALISNISLSTSQSCFSITKSASTETFDSYTTEKVQKLDTVDKKNHRRYWWMFCGS